MFEGLFTFTAASFIDYLAYFILCNFTLDKFFQLLHLKWLQNFFASCFEIYHFIFCNAVKKFYKVLVAYLVFNYGIKTVFARL